MRVLLSFVLISSCLLSALALPPSLISAFSATNSSIHSSGLSVRQDSSNGDDFLSYIKKIAAVGDSYSAGIGAGSRLTEGNPFDDGSDYACSRYDHSHPYLVNSDPRLGDSAGRSFQFKSCSGAVIRDVVEKQLPVIDGNQDVILLSAGGNDVDLVEILNQCIFQWAALDSGILDQARQQAQNYSWSKYIDWSQIALGCEGKMDSAQSYIDSHEFSSAIDGVILATKGKLAPGGMIYYTGYAKFFAEDLSTDCDTVTWSTWINPYGLFFQAVEYLTVNHRRKMNQLVDAVNKKLADAVGRAGPQVKFIDYDKYFGQFHGRFCEAGVDESTVQSTTRLGNTPKEYKERKPSTDDPHRTGLMFYELNTWDPFGGSPWKRDNAEPANGTFEADMNIFAQLTLLLDNNATLRNDEPTIQDKAFAIPKPLPDGYGRVFHPQILGHEFIASLILFEMENVWIQADGLPPMDEIFTFDSCAYKPLDPNGPLSEQGAQQVAIASYTNPLGDPAAWSRLIGYNSNKLKVLVANILNGPDYTVNDAWADVIKRAAASGKTIIGYVRTGYLGVSTQRFKTRLGSDNLGDWISQIEQDVDKWYELYPQLGGIFFDEGWPECGPDNVYSQLYAHINAYTKERHPGAFTVLNPGSPMASCFQNTTMDTLLTFESSYENYKNSYVPNDWMPQDARKIWHIVYNVPQDKVAEVLALAQSRGAGLIEITDDTLPNPYDNVPAESYIQAVMAGVTGTALRVAPGPPTDTTSLNGGMPCSVARVGATSITLQWDHAPNGLVKYSVEIGGLEVLSIPPGLTQATIGFLNPGTTGIVVSVSAIGPWGTATPPMFQTVDTTTLPGRGPITNIHVTDDGSQVIVEADILVPFAFVRLFLSGAAGESTYPRPGWPVNVEYWDGARSDPCYKVVNYLLEGNDFYSSLYKYTGAWHEMSTDKADWSWNPIASTTITQYGYTYRWAFPSSGNDLISSDYVIQGQGYAPIATEYGGRCRVYNGYETFDV